MTNMIFMLSEASSIEGDISFWKVVAVTDVGAICSMEQKTLGY